MDDAAARPIDESDKGVCSKKHQRLEDATLREEIDRTVERLDAVRRRAELDSYRRVVASKILDEGVLSRPSERLFADGERRCCPSAG
jgi:hypothetical protein